MARYPDAPRPASPMPFRSNRPTLTGGPEWAPQSFALVRFGLAEADLTYRSKSWADVATLYDFFENVGGPAGRFTFVDFNGIGMPGQADPGVPWSGLFVAKSDGLAVTWDLPTFGLQSSPAPVIYESGVSKTSEIGAHGYSFDPTKLYHVTKGDGTDGVDLLTYRFPSTVATAPSPATSGTSLILAAGTGAHFPATPFFANVWPTGVAPTAANVETVQVTGIATDTLTIVRAQNGTNARTVIVGDQFAVTPALSAIITIDGTCRRAMRRARFLAPKNPFTLNVPSNYSRETVTILEVRTSP